MHTYGCFTSRAHQTFVLFIQSECVHFVLYEPSILSIKNTTVNLRKKNVSVLFSSKKNKIIIKKITCSFLRSMLLVHALLKCMVAHVRLHNSTTHGNLLHLSILFLNKRAWLSVYFVSVSMCIPYQWICCNGFFSSQNTLKKLQISSFNVTYSSE